MSTAEAAHTCYLGCDSSCDVGIFGCDDGCDAACVCKEDLVTNVVPIALGADCDYAEVHFDFRLQVSSDKDSVCKTTQKGMLAVDVEGRGIELDTVRANVGLEGLWIWQGETPLHRPVCVDVFDALVDGALVLTLKAIASFAKSAASAEVCWTLNWTRADAGFVFQESVSMEVYGEASVFGVPITSHHVQEKLEAPCPILWRILLLVGAFVLPCLGFCCYSLLKTRRSRKNRGTSNVFVDQIEMPRDVPSHA